MPGKLTIYTRWTCEDSHDAKAYLDEHGIPYQEIDIDRDAKAKEFVKSVNEGKERTPTFEIEGRTFHTSPYSKEKLEKELGGATDD